jgi:hypothetical protein
LCRQETGMQPVSILPAARAEHDFAACMET